MNLMLAVAIMCLLTGMGGGALLAALIRKIRRWGKSFVVFVNPNTGDLDTDFRKDYGDHLKTKNADVPIPTDFRYTHKNRPAFIVNVTDGLPLKVGSVQELITLTGQRLKEIRRGIKIKLIAAANGADLEALAKYGLIGIGVLGVLLIGGFAILGNMLSR